MDPYSLKRDNRKKFQDKQRLKNRHATPSDRKYRALKFQAAQTDKEEAKDNEEADGGEEVEPPSNAYRYHEDVTMAFENPAEVQRDLEASKKIRDMLRSRDEQEEPLQMSASSKESVTTRNLNSMALDDLNVLLGAQTSGSNSEQIRPVNKTTTKTVKSAPRVAEKTETTLSMVPDELKAAQDFLDDLL